MQNADKSSSGRTRLLKGIVAVASQDILAPPTQYSYRGAGSRVAVAIGAAAECCAGGGSVNTNIPAPVITSVFPGDGYLDVYFDPTRSLTYWTVSTTSSVPGEVIADVSGSAPPIRVNNLVNMRAYTLHLSKTTPAGSSALSPPVTNAVPIPVPSEPTVRLVRGDRTLTATVGAPTSVGGSPIIRYEKSVGSPSSWAPITFSSGTTFTESGLTNGTPTTIYVRTVNSDGPGPAAFATGTPATVPIAPTISIIPGNQTLTVTVTGGDDGGSPIQGIELVYTGGGTTVTQTLPYNQAPLTYTAVSLANGTSYTIRATAINAVGASSTATASGTPATVPGSPTLSVSAGNQSLTVTVTAPASNSGAAITGYEKSLNAGASWSAVVFSSGTTFTESGLANDVAQAILVRAVNSRGAGSHASITGTPTAALPVPEAPVLTGVSSKTLTSITLTFTQTANGVTITNYKYSLNGGAFTAFSPLDTTSPVTINGLTAATSYAIQLKAVSANGDSTASNTITEPTYTERRVDEFTTSGTWTAPAGVTAVQYLIVGGGGGGGGAYSDIDVLGDVPVAATKPAGSTYWIKTTDFYYLQNNFARYSTSKPYRLTVKDPGGTSTFPLGMGGATYIYNKWDKDKELVYTGAPLATLTNYFSPYSIDTTRCNNISGGGGGGAGGEVKQLSGSSTYVVTPGASYSVTVGTGGAGGTANATTKTETNGSAGGSSAFDTITALGGSGGGYSRGGRPSNGYQTGGKGGFEYGNLISGQGGSGLFSNASGAYSNSNYAKYNTADGGIQGRYIDFDENGSSEIYAAGGPGGIPNTVSAVNATANTGNGGSGTGATLNSAANGRDGAAGIVKIKYYI